MKQNEKEVAMKARKISLYALPLLVTAALLFSTVALAANEAYYMVIQGEKQVQIEPVEGPAGVVDYYGYDETIFESKLPFREPDTAVIFLYRNTTSERVSLIMLLGGAGGSEGAAAFNMTGIPIGADFLVKDDEFDMRETWEISPPIGNVSWGWDAGKSDGLVLSPLEVPFELTITPGSTTGIKQVKFIHGAMAIEQETSLNMTDPIIIRGMFNKPPIAAFTASPVTPYTGEPVTFDASEARDPDGDIASYEWDFNGDGIIDTSTADPIITYEFPSSGLKAVSLRVSDYEGASSRYSYNIEVTAPAVRVSRTISTAAALPGTTFKVVIRIETDTELAGAGLQEQLPVTWDVNPVENAGAVFKRSETQWVFVDQIHAGTTRVISYEVTVPDSEELIAITLPASFDILGKFSSVTPSIEVPVEGDTDIEVTDALTIKTAVAHLVPRHDTTGDTIDLRLSQRIYTDQMERALGLWVSDEAIPGTLGATCDLETMKALAAYCYTCTPVDDPFPAVPMANVVALRTIDAPVPCNNILLDYYDKDGNPAGNRFIVNVEVTTDQDLYGVGLEEKLPPGWKVTPIENDGFVYKEMQVQWVLAGKMLAGSTKGVTYEVEVPQSESLKRAATDPCYVSCNDLLGTVDAALPCFEIAVDGDSAVAISDCLPVLVVISKWNAELDGIDITLSDKISFRQAQRAVAFWLEDAIVPRSCGEKIDYAAVRTIIAYWLTDEDICKVLPGRPSSVCEKNPCEEVDKCGN